jgi:hypothetical protein
VVDHYAAGGADDDEEGGGEPKAFVSVNWLLTEEPLDLETELALGFLNFLMLGTSAAPLRKALTDSGLGESLVGGGVEDELRQPVFSVGLKGVKEEDVPKVEALVMDTLAALAAEGFSPSAVEAAVNTIEFSLRENNTGRFPRGLSLMLRSMAAWIYDRDPFRPLKWHDDLERFKARVAAGEDVFAPLIRKFLLDNPHRVTVELRPDAALGEAIEAEEAARLAAAAAGMGDADRAAVVAATEALKARQETPDAAEALACMPSLRLADIPREISAVPTAASTSADGVTTLAHDLFTNDVLYLAISLDLRPVPADLLPLVPLFCAALTQMGTEKESFVELTERIGRKTGGLSVSPFVSAVRGSPAPVGFVTLRAKAMADKAGELLDLARDVLLSARLDDRDRFLQMALETKSGMEAGVVGAGHSFAGTRLDAQRGVAGWVSEQMGGISYLEYVRALVARVEADWEGVAADLQRIRAALLQRRGALVNMTGDERTLAAAQLYLPAFLEALPARGADDAAWFGLLPAQNEALLVPTQVNYVCKAANLYEDAGYELSGSSYVINKVLGTTWLWDRVRVSGGAYGGFCDFDTHSGMFTYSSYRDPNLLKTVDVYDGEQRGINCRGGPRWRAFCRPVCSASRRRRRPARAGLPNRLSPSPPHLPAPSPAGTAEFLRQLRLSPEELSKAVIGTVGDIDAYQLPDSKGRTAMMRHILGVTDEERQQRRDQVLSTSAKDFQEFAEVLAAVKDKARVVAVTSADKLAAAHEERPGFFSSVKRVV